MKFKPTTLDLTRFKAFSIYWLSNILAYATGNSVLGLQLVRSVIQEVSFKHKENFPNYKKCGPFPK